MALEGGGGGTALHFKLNGGAHAPSAPLLLPPMVHKKCPDLGDNYSSATITIIIKKKISGYF